MTGAAGPDIIICQKQNGYSLSHVSATEWDVAVQNVGKVVDAVLNEGWRTADIAAPGQQVIGTQKMGQLIREKI